MAGVQILLFSEKWPQSDALIQDKERRNFFFFFFNQELRHMIIFSYTLKVYVRARIVI